MGKVQASHVPAPAPERSVRGQSPGDLAVTATRESGLSCPCSRQQALVTTPSGSRSGTGWCEPVDTAPIREHHACLLRTPGGCHAPPRLLHAPGQTAHVRFTCPRFLPETPAVPSWAPSPTHPHLATAVRAPGSRTRPPPCPAARRGQLLVPRCQHQTLKCLLIHIMTKQ